MPRKRTGTAYPHGDHWDIRITLPDGKRSAPICLYGYSEERARAKARHLSERCEVEGATLVHEEKKAIDASTFGVWSDLWFASRERRGISAKKERGRWDKWVLDGAKLRDRKVASITKFDLEGIVERLDGAIQAKDMGLEGLAWKSAWNVWALVTVAFSDMAASKERSLRMRDDNAAAGVRGPDRGAKKAKGWLTPNDFLEVMSDESIPVRHRRALALAVYLYPRAGELRGLNWEDVSLDGGFVLFHHAERVDGTDTSTKTEDFRRTPIESTLWPLLKAMHDERGEGRVTNLPDDQHLARWLRETLQWVGVASAELKASPTRKAITWHDLRATGITWRAIRGDDHLKIKGAAGHRNFSTTEGYIRAVEAVDRATFGEVFPVLPEALLKTEPPANRHSVTRMEAKSLKSLWRRRESNPRPRGFQ